MKSKSFSGPSPCFSDELLGWSLPSFLLSHRYPWVRRCVRLECFICAVQQNRRLPEQKRRGDKGGNATERERTLKYKEPLEGSKYPWRGKKRKKGGCGGQKMGHVPGEAGRKCSEILVDRPPDRTELFRLVYTWLVSNNGHIMEVFANKHRWIVGV